MNSSDNVSSNEDYDLDWLDLEAKLMAYKVPYNISLNLTLACFSICSVVGVVGNGLVIWIAGFKMKTASAVWFTNLAIADFMFCISLPFRVILRITGRGNDFFLITVMINLVMINLNSFVCVAFITAISIDRCVSIMWPQWAKIHRTRRGTIICSVFLWILPLAVVAISMNYINVIDVHIGYMIVPFYDELLIYAFGIIAYHHTLYLIYLRSFLTFLTSLIIILVSYGLIIMKIRSTPMNRPKRFQKTLRIIMAVVACFFVSWFPFNIWPILAKNMDFAQIPVYFIVSQVCLCLVSISRCINPILYVLLSRKRETNLKKGIKSTIMSNLNE